MKNKYLNELNKIEFVVTNACTGRCKHCSEGFYDGVCERIDPTLGADAVRRIAALYGIKTVMCFGGEPLLYIEAVEKIMSAAVEMGIEHRQVITNGFFTHEPEVMRETVGRLASCGVNDLLVSVDAFHQETIPLCTVRDFISEAVRIGISVRLNPAWLVSPTDENPYNEKTREILGSFDGMNVAIGEGNVVFPEGNALKFLGEYFAKAAPENPYTEDPCRVKCVSFAPNGDVLDGNVYRTDIMEILERYAPK